MLKTQSNLPPPPPRHRRRTSGRVLPFSRAVAVAVAVGDGGGAPPPHNGCSRLSLAHATPFGQAASSSGSRHMHRGHAASSRNLEMVPERAIRAGSCCCRSCCRRPGSLQLLAIMSLSLAGISRGCHRRRSPSPSFKRHGVNLDPRLADCRQRQRTLLPFLPSWRWMELGVSIPWHDGKPQSPYHVGSPRHETVSFSSQPGKQIEVECDENFEGCLPRDVNLVNFDIICLIPSAHQGLNLFETFLPGLPVSSGVRPAAQTQHGPSSAGPCHA